MKSNVFATSWTIGDWFVDDDHIVTENLEEVVGKEIKDEVDPFRGGAKKITKDNNGTVVGVYLDDTLYDEHSTGNAWGQTTDYIRGLVNYFLGLIGFVALLYLLYHGFLTLIAGDDDEKMKKGIKGIKYAAIALVGLGVSWLLLSFVFWLIFVITQ